MSRGMSGGIKLLAALLLALLATPLAAQSLPVHGNWCGIGHSGGQFGATSPATSPLLPTDPLDAACMHHDICAGQRGRFDCGCDISFMQELRATPWPNPGFQAKARAIYDSIAMLPCTNPQGQAIKAEMFMNDWLSGVFSGRESPWEMLRRLGYLGHDGVEQGWR